MMREMRLQQLTISLGEKPTAEFPKVRAVIMDWPIERAIVTVIARSTGDASIYTTGTFGVLGGIGHETVRNAAVACVKIAQHYSDDATPTKEFPYPTGNRVRFYLVCYDGVREIDADLDGVRQKDAKYFDMYAAAQQVVTELRLITQNQKGQRP